jgi:APA family basic amino acid/polyamine antiporter
MGALICLAQMVGLPLATWERLMIWLVIGLVLYFTYSRSHVTQAEQGYKATATRG